MCFLFVGLMLMCCLVVECRYVIGMYRNIELAASIFPGQQQRSHLFFSLLILRATDLHLLVIVVVSMLNELGWVVRIYVDRTVLAKHIQNFQMLGYVHNRTSQCSHSYRVFPLNASFAVCGVLGGFAGLVGLSWCTCAITYWAAAWRACFGVSLLPTTQPSTGPSPSMFEDYCCCSWLIFESTA